MNRTSYPYDLNEAEWLLLEALLLSPKPGGRPIKYPRREIVNAVLYIVCTGAAWRMLPHDLAPTASSFITIAPGSWMASATISRASSRVRPAEAQPMAGQSADQRQSPSKSSPSS